MDRLDLERRLDALASLAEPRRPPRSASPGSWPPTTSTSSPRPGCSRSASSAAAAGAGPAPAGRQRSTCAPPARWRSPCQPGTTSSSPSCSPTRCGRTRRAPRVPRSSGRPAPPAPRTPSTRTRAAAPLGPHPRRRGRHQPAAAAGPVPARLSALNGVLCAPGTRGGRPPPRPRPTRHAADRDHPHHISRSVAA
jgi:phosphoribosylglycinamide formyltransferase 2